MDSIYSIATKYPELVTWLFALVNAVWIVFIYFNKKKHERALLKLKKSIDLDLERRKKIFEMKTSQYEDYFRNVDAIHKRHQNDYQEIVVPIIDEFNASFQRAMASGDREGATESSILFSSKINKITLDGLDELQIIRSQTNTLRLTASDEVAKLLDELQDLYESLFQMSQKMISDIVSIAVDGNQALALENQAKFAELGKLTIARSLELREQMRLDLKCI